MGLEIDPHKKHLSGSLILVSKKLNSSNKKILTLLFIIGITFACSAPALSPTQSIQPPQNGAQVTSTVATETTIVPTNEPTITNTGLNSPSATPLPVATQESANPSQPIITFERNTNCRRGPAINYFQMTSFLKEHSTKALGRNSDSSWFWVASPVKPTIHCWVIASNLKKAEAFDYLPIIDFPALPQAPSQLAVEKRSCGSRNIIILKWANISGETGFHFFRNGIMLANLNVDAVSYTDNPPRATKYLYEVESINDFGISVRMAVTVQGCV